MADNSTPLTVDELESVLETVSRNLLERWAISDRFTEEQMEEAVHHCVDDVSFIINNYMELVNHLMLTKATDSGIISA